MSHTLYPHGELQRVCEGVWQVEGSMKLPLKRNMTVFRLNDGRLVLYSVVAMNDAGMAALEALGTPWLMVVPGTHTMDAPFYKKRYPGLLVAGDADLAGLSRDGDAAGLLKGTEVEVLYPEGMKVPETCLLAPSDGGTVLAVCDILGGKMPRLPGIGGRLFALLGPPGDFGVARIVKFRQVASKPKLRTWLLQLAARPKLRAVLAAHGPALKANVAGALQVAAEQL